MTKPNLKPADSVLTTRLRERIQRAGPITFHEWMDAALYDEHEGYYCRRDRQRWGREGDYRTSPERSALFAATFARYFASLYEKLHRPGAWTIVEAGAGDGQFARGVLEALQTSFPEVFAATQFVIDEVNVNSLSCLQERLEPFLHRVQFRSLDDLAPINPGVIFSNELLDAFPVHRVTVRDGELCELYVAIGANGAFAWKLGPLSTPDLARYFEAAGTRLQEGQDAEVNLDLEKWLTRAAKKLACGYLITVDYGAEAADLYASPARHQGTLRAFYQHQLVNDVLARPGEQDITSTVDWSFVKRVGEKLGFEAVELERQDKFLLKAGLLEELEQQSQRAANDAERVRLSTTAREMILPNGMAASFQVLVQSKELTD